MKLGNTILSFCFLLFSVATEVQALLKDSVLVQKLVNQVIKQMEIFEPENKLVTTLIFVIIPGNTINIEIDSSLRFPVATALIGAIALIMPELEVVKLKEEEEEAEH